MSLKTPATKPGELEQNYFQGNVSVKTPPTKPAGQLGDDADLAPPEEDFWQRYSPRHEFPISTIATIAIHVVVVAAVIYIALKLMKPDEKTPVPITGVTVSDSSNDGTSGDAGAGGGEPNIEAGDDRPQEKSRPIPQEVLEKRMIAASSWDPAMIDNPIALAEIAKSPNFKQLQGLNDEIKRRIAKEFTEKQGEGGNGSGTAKDGKGSGGSGSNPASSGSRSNRWVITFKTSNGQDYLRQLAAFEARIVVPQPPDWEKNRLFENIANPGDAGKMLRPEDALPEMRFIDNNGGSAQRIARALRLDYSPPYFLAYFPKKVEDDLAAKERAYRNRSEDQIRETTFSVVEINGRYEIKVTDQIEQRK